MTTTIAHTLISQLGTALPMLGAKNLLDTGKGLQFKIGRNPKRVTHVQIELDPSDTYTLTFLRVPGVRAMCRGAEQVELACVSFIHCDQLHTTLETHTGNYCSL
jgi:hypothetical protein